MTAPYDDLIRIRWTGTAVAVVPATASTRVGRRVAWALDGVTGVARISFSSPAAFELTAVVDMPAIASFSEAGERRYEVRLTIPDKATSASAAVLIVDP